MGVRISRNILPAVRMLWTLLLDGTPGERKAAGAGSSNSSIPGCTRNRILHCPVLRSAETTLCPPQVESPGNDASFPPCRLPHHQDTATPRLVLPSLRARCIPASACHPTGQAPINPAWVVATGQLGSGLHSQSTHSPRQLYLKRKSDPAAPRFPSSRGFWALKTHTPDPGPPDPLTPLPPQSCRPPASPFCAASRHKGCCSFQGWEPFFCQRPLGYL